MYRDTYQGGPHRNPYQDSYRSHYKNPYGETDILQRSNRRYGDDPGDVYKSDQPHDDYRLNRPRYQERHNVESHFRNTHHQKPYPDLPHHNTNPTLPYEDIYRKHPPPLRRSRDTYDSRVYPDRHVPHNTGTERRRDNSRQTAEQRNTFEARRHKKSHTRKNHTHGKNQ
eukprot:TRINITY_DN6396_c0_g1_i1.p1 TRINITY_DN6396_c0_g1~~TRINITY_DN6396_c0_g1_i1.p1  ORF type:complete len:169 (+),score=11.07 TRINITY_DN6396_c0_g1_i1:378-884(+)